MLIKRRKPSSPNSLLLLGVWSPRDFLRRDSKFYILCVLFDFTHKRRDASPLGPLLSVVVVVPGYRTRAVQHTSRKIMQLAQMGQQQWISQPSSWWPSHRVLFSRFGPTSSGNYYERCFLSVRTMLSQRSCSTSYRTQALWNLDSFFSGFGFLTLRVSYIMSLEIFVQNFEISENSIERRDHKKEVYDVSRKLQHVQG